MLVAVRRVHQQHRLRLDLQRFEAPPDPSGSTFVGWDNETVHDFPSVLGVSRRAKEDRRVRCVGVPGETQGDGKIPTPLTPDLSNSPNTSGHLVSIPQCGSRLGRPRKDPHHPTSFVKGPDLVNTTVESVDRLDLFLGLHL